jgi:hypothetical protein
MYFSSLPCAICPAHVIILFLKCQGPIRPWSRQLRCFSAVGERLHHYVCLIWLSIYGSWLDLSIQQHSKKITSITVCLTFWSPKLVWIIFKNSVRTAKKTPHFTITKTNWLTLFKEIIAVYSKNHIRPINTKCRATDCWSRWCTYLPLGFKGLSGMKQEQIPGHFFCLLTLQERYGSSPATVCDNTKYAVDKMKLHQGLMRQVLDHLQKCQHSAWGGHVTWRTLPGWVYTADLAGCRFHHTQIYLHVVFINGGCDMLSHSDKEQRLTVSEDKIWAEYLGLRETT